MGEIYLTTDESRETIEMADPTTSLTAEEKEYYRKVSTVARDAIFSKATPTPGFSFKAEPSSTKEIFSAPPAKTEGFDEEVLQKEIENIKNHKDYGNFVMRIQNLVSRILEQLNVVSEKDRTQVQEMKKNYKKSSHDAANIQRQLGNAGLYISSFAFLLLMGQFGFTVPSDREVMKFLSEQAPQIGGMFTSRLQAGQQEATALSQLILAEYNAKTSKTQSEANSKNEVLQLLQSVIEVLKRASSQN